MVRQLLVCPAPLDLENDLCMSREFFIEHHNVESLSHFLVFCVFRAHWSLTIRVFTFCMDAFVLFSLVAVQN